MENPIDRLVDSLLPENIDARDEFNDYLNKKIKKIF